LSAKRLLAVRWKELDEEFDLEFVGVASADGGPSRRRCSNELPDLWTVDQNGVLCPSWSFLFTHCYLSIRLRLHQAKQKVFNSEMIFTAADGLHTGLGVFYE